MLLVDPEINVLTKTKGKEKSQFFKESVKAFNFVHSFLNGIFEEIKRKWCAVEEMNSYLFRSVFHTTTIKWYMKYMNKNNTYTYIQYGCKGEKKVNG